MDCDSLEFEWDNTKRESNLNKHGLDFVDAVKIFLGPVVTASSHRSGEDRWISVGMVNGLEIAVVYIWREGRIRIISARRAKRNERQEYHTHLSD